MTTGFLYDPGYLAHDTGRGHPESSDRLVAAMRHLEAQPWFEQLERCQARAAEREWISTIHSDAYIERARQTVVSGHPYLDSLDVAISAASFDTAVLAVGGALALADALMDEHIDNGFALLRPPGHHAEHGEAMGFCMFNNVAILARYLQQQYGLDKILILDWDVHHGNGSQHSFDEDPAVMYVSTHQYPYYPGTGAATETGHGRGEGTIVNCPMAAGSGDALYERAFRDVILPRIAEFAPEAVIISAGFDAHEADPLGQITLSTEFFTWMSERMMEVADQHAGGRLLSLLEGGYNLQQMPRCVDAHLRVLAGVVAAND